MNTFAPDRIIVHHTATPDGQVYDWPGIVREHSARPGWRGVGYHLGFEMADGKPVGHLGRPLNWVGSHCRAGHMNERSIGVAFVGNYDDVSPDVELINYAGRVLAGLMDLLGWFGRPMEELIQPHRAYANTRCPGSMFSLEELRERVQAEGPCCF